MKIKYFLLKNIFLLITIFLILSCSKQEPASPIKDRDKAWIEDINVFSSQLKARQIDFSLLIPEKNFDNAVENVKASISSLNDYEIFLKLKEIVSALKVAHTSIMPNNPSQKYHLLPILTHYFNEGLYIVYADNQNKQLMEKKILKVGGKEISELKDSLAKIVSYENIYWFEEQFPAAVSVVECLKYYGFTNTLSEVELEIEGIGKTVLKSTEQTNESFISSLNYCLEGKVIPLYMQNANLKYWYKYLSDNKMLYVNYNSCSNIAGYPFTKFAEEIRNFIDSNDVQKFVMDLRNNGGGNSSTIDPIWFIKDTPLNKTGSLFVITGNHTFSSGVMNAISFKTTTNCILVGEPTGGKPNSYGEVEEFVLPNSGLIVNYCIKYFRAPWEDRDALFPDYNIEITAEDYFKGRDPVLDYILTL